MDKCLLLDIVLVIGSYLIKRNVFIQILGSVILYDILTNQTPNIEGRYTEEKLILILSFTNKKVINQHTIRMSNNLCK
jgi:hypothetical protein